MKLKQLFRTNCGENLTKKEFNMEKKVKVMMIPTKDESSIILDAFDRIGLSKYYGKPWKSTAGKDEYQHLYFVSDDNPKKGDIVLNTENNTIGVYAGMFSSEKSNRNTNAHHVEIDGAVIPVVIFRDWNKVVATTDVYLLGREYYDANFNYYTVPKIPESFVTEFVNSLGEMDEVTIATKPCYDSIPEDEDEIIGSWRAYVDYKAKLTEDNEVIIIEEKAVEKQTTHKVYSREQVIKKIREYNEYLYAQQESILPENYFEEWIKENV